MIRTGRHSQKGCKDTCCGLCCTKIENFSVTVGKTEILKDINLHIHCGELTAIIGPNGAGKSTLLKALLGEVAHSGKLNFMHASGSTTGNMPVMGYVPQNLNLDATTPTSVEDLFLATVTSYPAWLLKPKKQIERIRQRLAKVNGEHLLTRRLGALSGGELQRVLLALALEPVPDLLLLDEPVSGIDQNGLELFYKTLSELKKAYDLSIILVSHDLDMVKEYADRVVLLNKTVLASGPPEEILNSEMFYQVFSLKWQRQKGGGAL